ncbi:MAG: porin [Planctomycetaceae bacterium]
MDDRIRIPLILGLALVATSFGGRAHAQVNAPTFGNSNHTIPHDPPARLTLRNYQPNNATPAPYPVANPFYPSQEGGEKETAKDAAKPAKASDVSELKKELEKLEKEIESLKKKSKPKKRTEEVDCKPDKVYYTVPLVGERLQDMSGCADEPNTKPFMRRWGADYNKGFLISPLDPKRDKFQLKVNGWIQFRHIGFARDEDNWTDNAGVTREIRNRNHFDIERGRLVFSGYAIDPKLTYFLQLDGDSDGREGVDFFDYWWAWKFSDALRIQAGKRKVAASRRWLMGARDSRFVDRPIATDFFRPDRTVGLWATGKFDDTLFYEMNLGNGYRTAARNSFEIDDKLSFAATGWWDVAGPFGKSITDHAMSDETLVRVGHSFAYAPQAGTRPGAPLRESTFLRLADGTVLSDTGALAPGVTVSKSDVLLYALDFGWKDNGWSVSAEAYFRWLRNLAGDGALPVDSIQQRGFFVELGSVINPNYSDWNVRYSEIRGDFGGGRESSVGLNFYPLGKSTVKVAFDVSYYDGSPLNNTASDVLAGDAGLLFRTQFQAQF